MGLSRSTIIRIATFIGGIYFVAEFLTPKRVLDQLAISPYHDRISYGFVTISIAALGLGLINLISGHSRRIFHQRSGWINSVALLVGLSAMLTFGALNWRENLRITNGSKDLTILAEFAKKIVAEKDSDSVSILPFTERRDVLIQATDQLLSKRLAKKEDIFSGDSKLDSAYAAASSSLNIVRQSVVDQQNSVEKDSVAKDFGGELSLLNNLSTSLANLATLETNVRRVAIEKQPIHGMYVVLVEGLFNSLGAAMFSLLAVYIASAAFRAFRVRSFESSLMMIAALLVILGQTFFGLWISESLPSVRLWLLEVPNSAAFRAIKFGAAIAGLVMAFRMWFSIESEDFEVGSKGSGHAGSLARKR